MTKPKTRKNTNARPLSQVLEGYELAANARGLSSHTLADYQNTYRKFRAFLADRLGIDDPPFQDISRQMVEAFLASLTVKNKTKLNYHTGLAALWTWAYGQGYVSSHILHDIERPKPEKREIMPYTEADIRAMLQALSSSRSYNNRGTTSSHRLPNQERNRAIILLLLDTGIRAEELCTLTVANVDLRNERILVFGKGSKERIPPICSRTSQAISHYWCTRRPDRQPTDPAFTTEDGNPLDRHLLRKGLVAIAERAGIRGADVHRFRHTFAISYLRNGGDVYTLQDILGHATMEMCRRYLRLAQSDKQAAHKRASPVANMRL